MEYSAGALPPNHEVRILVQATCPVIGLWPDQIAEVYPSLRVEKLIKMGHLIWLDKPEDDNGNLDDGQDPDHAV